MTPELYTLLEYWHDQAYYGDAVALHRVVGLSRMLGRDEVNVVVKVVGSPLLYAELLPDCIVFVRDEGDGTSTLSISIAKVS